MKTKSLAIILVLAMLILAGGAAYSANGPKGGTFGCSASGYSDDHKVIAIPIFSDFLILIYIKDISPLKADPWEEFKNNDGPFGNKENSDSGKSIKFKGKSYQIIFSR